MDVDFEDAQLKRLFEDANFRLPSVGLPLTRAFRKVVGVLHAASDERDLRGMKSLRFEKLAGKRADQYSVRLNDQWRLILRVTSHSGEKQLVVIEIADYH
jgi:proteic killer suppression protein